MQAKATDISDGLLPLTNKASYEPYLDNYIKQVIEQVSTEANADIYSAGLDVYTNLDPDIQKYIWNVYNSNDYIAYPDDKFQVASTIIDVTNGRVVAQLGSRHQDENIALGTNQAVQTDRDWGSTMKPITDYAPAIEKGYILTLVLPFTIPLIISQVLQLQFTTGTASITEVSL